MELLLLWLACGVLSAVIASSRGRSGFGWLLLGAIFGVFGVIAVIALPALKPTARPSAASPPSRPEDRTGALPATKICPRCAEEVRAAALVCRYCGHEFADAPGRTPPTEERAAVVVGDGKFKFEVAGEASYQGALAAFAGPKTEQGVRHRCAALLVPEPDNPHDPRAVTVVIDGATVGYLPREVTRHFRAALAEGGYSAAAAPALIVGGWRRGSDDEGHYGVKLDIALPFTLRDAEAGVPRDDKPPAVKPTTIRPRRSGPATRLSATAVTSTVVVVIGVGAIILWAASGDRQVSPPQIAAKPPAPAPTESATTPAVAEAAAAAKAELTSELGAVVETLPELWKVITGRSAIDDSATVHLQSAAIAPVRIGYGDHRPVLTIRCLENTTSAIINFDGAFVADSSGFGTVTFRIDEKQPFDRELTESTDNEALGLWSGGSAIPFARSLFGGERLLVRAIPFNESPVTFEFEIAGLERQIAPLREACHW